MKILSSILCFALLMATGVAATAAEREQASEHRTLPNGGQTAIVFLHGKGGHPEAGFLQDFFADLRERGYHVVAPEMPWSRFRREGTFEDAFAEIDAAVQGLSPQYNQILLAGHSMGATVALAYAGKKTANNLFGVVPIAMAHVPQMSPVLLEVIRDSLAEANELANQGRVRERHLFRDLNNGKTFQMEATVEHYLSFYDPRRFPDIKQVVSEIQIPVLWLSAEDDRLTDVYSHRALYKLLPANQQNDFVLLPGGHKSVLQNAGGAISAWLNRIKK